MQLNTPVSALTRVGEATQKYLARLGVKNARELLYYFPFRYEDYSRLLKIKQLTEGEMVTVKVKIELISNKRTPRWRKIITEALVSDDTGSLRVVWFNQPFLIKNLKPGDLVYLSGKVQTDMIGSELLSPAYEKVTIKETANTARLVPVYPLTEGITQKQLRFLITQVIGLAERLPEWLPDKIRRDFNLIKLGDAVKGIHFPDDQKHLDLATHRLKFDEVFVLQLQSELARLEKNTITAPQIVFKEAEIKEFVQSLPYALTKAQKIAAWEILKDTGRTVPMNRLLSGDVGSGKTIVAAITAFNAALNSLQTAVMAPTEILAKQHFDSFVKLLGGKVKIALLTRSQIYLHGLDFTSTSKKGQKEELLAKVNGGEIKIVIGTHALLNEDVVYPNLGLVVVDEQHRFGVNQRRIIKSKGEGVHFLSMTATPIPRSLALMLYGDLDISILNEMPAGRKKILTRLVEPHNRNKAYEFIRAQVKTGRQVFVICPLIEEKEKNGGEAIEVLSPYSLTNDKKTVMTEYEKLSQKIFPDLKVNYLHGKMKSEEKEKIMQDFKNHVFDILVSTSVVEVGVDVPNAAVMMIEDAEKFGLAQLHQFRGRVGRSVHQSYCFIFTSNTSQKVLDRLKFFEGTNDGFKLAEHDLEIRGPGEVYGTVQSGLMNLRLAKLTDREIIKISREAAKTVAKEWDKYPSLKKELKEWEQKVHLE
ncbi:MAG TPA: ATP-dependent DNA helicase RecG [Patescibacteria group bacterium]|nr:ATP-dependent DNA helicase RecG [Patescibacteria group bacterium]